MTMTLTSRAFAEGGRIPDRYTADGDDVSPPLAWTGTPEGTRSFALVCSDPDAPVGTWYHWGLFDLPAGRTHLEEAFPAEGEVGPIRQALSDFRRPGYGGPAPPRGHGIHRYRFRLMALAVDRLHLPASPLCRDVERAAAAHILGEATLTGLYSR